MLVLLLALCLAACASPLTGEPDEALIRDLVTVRAWDGHTGFSTPEGRRSYGWRAKDVLVERGAESVPALADALGDPSLDATQRGLVRETLREIGPEAADAVPTLVAEMNGADTDTIERVCRVLAQIGYRAARAVPELERLLCERGAEVTSPTFAFGDYVMAEGCLRTTIAYTLGTIGPSAEHALPVLAAGAVQTQDVEYRRACRGAIRKILGPDSGAAP